MASKSLCRLLRCRPSAAFVKFNTFKQYRAVSQTATPDGVAAWLNKKFPDEGYGDKFKEKGITGWHLRMMDKKDFQDYGVEDIHYFEIRTALLPAAGAAATAGAAVEKPVTKLKKEDFKIETCKRVSLEGGNENLIGVEECVEKCVKVISAHLTSKGSGVKRIPPLMLSRCMRGGKTTVLCNLFDKLKKEEKYTPIFITFNGDAGRHRVTRKHGESLLACLVRAIAWALVMFNEGFEEKTAADVSCKEQTLKHYLKDKENVVLLVDEFNKLLTRDEKEADTTDIAHFVRRELLDKAGRYFGFTTHIPNIPITQALGKRDGTSSREIVVVNLPQEFRVENLNKMDHCQKVTKCSAAYYGFIPSIIFTVNQPQSSGSHFNFPQRFFELWEAKHKGKIAELRADFLSEFFNGDPITDSPLRDFDSITTYDEDRKVQWVVGYAGLLCGKLGWTDVEKLIEELEVTSEMESSGKGWETIINTAIALRCREAMLPDVKPHELLGFPEDWKPKNFSIRSIPKEYKKTEETLKWWKTQDKDKFPRATLLVTNSPTFKVLDSILVCEDDKDKVRCVTGFQMKEGSCPPDNSPPKEVTHGVWLEGDALKRDGKDDFGWKRPNTDEVKDFLGISLAMLYPALKPH